MGLVHRLDRPTSGVVVLAKTSKGAARISEQFRAGTVRKTYWAMVEGDLDPPGGEWVDRLEKDRTLNRVHVVEEDDDADEGVVGKEARVAYRRLRKVGRHTLVELMPGTGRGHQLRVQLASRGLPIVGDRKYGSRRVIVASDGGTRILLHARELRFNHPTTKEELAFVAPLPEGWGPDS